MIRIHKRVIATLDSPNLDIRTNPSNDDEDSENEEEYSWEMVVSFIYKVKTMFWYVGVLVKLVWCSDTHLIW